MPRAPQDEIPCDAVPETDEQHRRELTDEDHRPCGDGFISAYPAIEWVEEIRTDPLRERNVPAVPKLSDIGFAVR